MVQSVLICVYIGKRLYSKLQNLELDIDTYIIMFGC